MSPPVKIPLTAKDKRSLRRRLVGNYILLVVLPGIGIAAIPLSAEVYSSSQTILPWIINTAIAALVIYLIFVFVRLIKRLGSLLAGGKKFRERVSLKDAKVYEKRTNSKNGVRINYFLEMHDQFKFFITYRQFVLAKELQEFYIEYKPYSYDHIDVIQSLDFNKEIEALQLEYALQDKDLVARIKQALSKVRSRTDGDPEEPGEPDHEET